MKINVLMKRSLSTILHQPPKTIHIPDNVQTIQELITVFVQTQMKEYLFSTDEYFTVFTDSQYLENEQIGRFRSSRQFPISQINEKDEIDKAFQMIEDGLVVVFVDNVKYTHISDMIQIHEESLVTIIKLTFLAGRGY